MEHAMEERPHILVCLSPAPSNEKVIRMAADMARAYEGRFTALFVETSDFAAAGEENKHRLRDNQALAKQLGAAVETVFGEDIPYQIAEFARSCGVTKIVLGHSAVKRRRFWARPALTEQLLLYAPETEIHIIPNTSAAVRYRLQKIRSRGGAGILENVLKSVAILTGATLLCLLFHRLGFTDANMIMVYILSVLLTSVVTSHPLYSLVSSIVSVFIFNYLFTFPRFSFAAYGTSYPVTFVVMFLTAYITGTLAIRYKEQAWQSAKAAYRTKILFDTDQMLSKAGSREEILNTAVEQIRKLLGRNIVIYETQKDALADPQYFGAPERAESVCDPKRERAAAEWVLQNNHCAGATTQIWSDAQFLYYGLRIHERVYGVVGIEAKNNPLDASEQSILLSILGECALALENDQNVREKEKAAILAENEQLRANLLRTISHDLRTPLTAISGHASNLMNNGQTFDEKTKQQLYADIYNDSMWLISLVENLLYATRIEEGRMTLRTSAELLSEIVEEAISHVRCKEVTQRISAVFEDDLLLVRADARLMVQVIVNIIDNAVKYTPPDSEIIVKTCRRGDMAQVQIADNGKGIPDEEKEKVFDKFYCGTNKIADNRRSLGLGLYLCKAIVEAHQGTICVTDNHPRGAVFCFTLPTEEVILHE